MARRARRRLRAAGIALALALVAGTQAHAITISLVALPASVAPEAPVDVEIAISGLASPGPPSLGAFELAIAFDDGVLSYLGVTFGPYLGSPPTSAYTESSETAGVVDLLELSLLSVATLNALQPAAFLLATLHFDGLAAGETAIEITDAILGDALGNPLSASLVGASVVVLPEPATLALLAAGLASLSGLRQRLGR